MDLGEERRRFLINKDNELDILRNELHNIINKLVDECGEFLINSEYFAFKNNIFFKFSACYNFSIGNYNIVDIEGDTLKFNFIEMPERYKEYYDHYIKHCYKCRNKLVKDIKSMIKATDEDTYIDVDLDVLDSIIDKPMTIWHYKIYFTNYSNGKLTVRIVKKHDNKSTNDDIILNDIDHFIDQAITNKEVYIENSKFYVNIPSSYEDRAFNSANKYKITSHIIKNKHIQIYFEPKYKIDYLDEIMTNYYTTVDSVTKLLINFVENDLINNPITAIDQANIIDTNNYYRSLLIPSISNIHISDSRQKILGYNVYISFFGSRINYFISC